MRTVIALSILIMGVAFASPASSSGTLKGGIEHAARITSPSPRLSPGMAANGISSIFSGDDNWYSIPSWMAGTWDSVQVVRCELYDCNSGEVNLAERILPDAKEEETIGFQKDRSNAIWTIKQFPTPHKVVRKVSEDNSKTTITETYRENSLISANESKVILKTMDTKVTIDKKDNKIATVERRESIRYFVPVGDNALAVYSDSQTYDDQGFPLKREQLAEIKKRKEDFKVVDEIGGRSLFSSFVKFLEKTGQIRLEPARE